MENPEGGWVLGTVNAHNDLRQMSVLRRCIQGQDYDSGAYTVGSPITLTPVAVFSSPFNSVMAVSNRMVPASEMDLSLSLMAEMPDSAILPANVPSYLISTIAGPCPRVSPSQAESEEVTLKQPSLREVFMPEANSTVAPIGEITSCAILKSDAPSAATLKTKLLADVAPMAEQLGGLPPAIQSPAGIVPLAEELNSHVPVPEKPATNVTTDSVEQVYLEKLSPGFASVVEESTCLDHILEEPANLICITKETSDLIETIKEPVGMFTETEEPPDIVQSVSDPAGFIHIANVPSTMVHLSDRSPECIHVAEKHASLFPEEKYFADLFTEAAKLAELVHVGEEPDGLVQVDVVPAKMIHLGGESDGLVPVSVREEPDGFVRMRGEPNCLVYEVEEPTAQVCGIKETSQLVTVAEPRAVLTPVAKQPVLVPKKELFAAMGVATDSCISGMQYNWPCTAAVFSWNATNIDHTPSWVRETDVNRFSVLTHNQESSWWTPDRSQAVPVQGRNSIKPEIRRRTNRILPYLVCEKLRDSSLKACKKNADSSPLIKQNAELVFALQELEHRCISLQEENNLLRKNTFPETDEKVKRLKKKNAELAVIAKRLEERAHKLQEANLKVMKAPVHLKGSSIEVCKKAFARQRAKDLAEQANALLAKDKQIEALQQECQELKAKLAMGTECSNWLNLCDLDRLLRESQKEVLRLQRQIAIKYLKESLHLSKVGARGSSPFTVISMGATGGIHIDTSVLSGPVEEGEDVASEKPSSGKDEQELELSKKRKEFENLEQEVKKKQKRCEQLEIILKEVKSENVKLLEENSRLGGRAARTHKVESENADLKSLLVSVTEQRDSAVQERQQLQSKLENLEQVLKHMREVAERRQQLEKEHEDALIALQGRQEEVKRLHQAHVEAKREHEGAVHLLENTLDCMQARVKDLEEKCLSQTKQFSLLSQELERFRLNNGKIDLFPSKVVTSELPTPPCCSSPKENHNEKDLPTASFDDNIKDGVAEMQGVHQPCNAICNINKFTVELPSLVNEKEKKKSETFPSSPKSGSHNSSKSCNSTEVDTASEMEEIEVDSVSVIPEPQSRPPAKLQVFLARYSYNPFDGPNENPEAELPLTAGEYIYIYGETDDDGFYEGELMDGRRGLVPSNFVERVSDDDLMTAQPPEVSELSHSSFQDTSFISSCSVERSNLPEEEEGSLSPLLSGLPRSSNEQTDISAVPYPRKLTLIKQLARSIVVGWEPPLVPAGCGSIQSYNIYLDTELRQNVQCGSPTKALLEKLDLKTKVYRVSVQSVTENGNSDRWRCTLLVGSGYSIAPAHLRVRSLTATSAEITWQPSNSNYAHAVYLNEEECGLTKAGTYWYVLRNLRPSTQYNVKVESRPHRTPWVLPPERQENKSTVMQLTTPSAGPPDAPLDVQVELGPTPGILIISWLPVTIDAAGTSNGVRVTGYAVYADGQKVLEVTSPTAGSVLLGMSHLQLLQVSREVSVRTMSPQGESVDSVPAQIPSALLKVPDSLFLLNNSLVYEPPFSEYLDSRKRLTSSPYSTQSETTSKSNAKLSNQTVANEFEIKEHTLHTESPVGGGGQFDSLPNEEPVNDLDLGHCAFSGHPCRVISQSISLLEAKAHMANIQGTPCTIVHAADCGHPVEHALHPKFCEVSAIPRMSTLPAIDSNLQHENQELPLFGSSVWNCQITLSDFELKKEARNARISEKQMKDGVTHLNQAEKVSESCLSSETALSECDRDHVNKAGFRGGSVQEFLELSSDEKVDAEDSFTWQTTDEAEEKEMSNPEDVHFASPANRSSDLSDILEEEEDNQHTEMPTKNKFSQKDHDNIGESSGKLDSCETDSDEDILERILELPLQKYCNKKLFSIPEVTEEEEDDDESLAPQETNVHPSCSKESLNYYIAEDMALLKNLQEVPKTNICEPDQNSLPGASGEGQLDTFYPDEQIVPQQDWCLRKNACVSDQQESSVTCTSAEIAGCHKNKDCYTNEQPKGRCESFRKSHTFVKEQCSRLLSSCNQPGGSRRKMHVLNERVTSGACDFPKADIDIWKGRQGTSHNSCRKHASSFTKPTSKSTSSFFTKGMEIDIEYDTEDEDGVLNISKSVIQQSPDCRLKGHHLSCSSWSSQFDSTLSRQKRKELTQQAVVESDGNGYLSCENGVTSVWSGPAQSQMNSFDPRRDSEDRGWRKEHNKMICKERHKRHEKENPDVSLHSRICGSQSRNSIFQLSACAPLKQGSIRKMKLNQQANHSDEARDDLKDLTSEDLKRVTLEVMKESDLELSNTAILEGVRSSKKSLQHDSLRLFVALFDYDPVTMSPNLDAAFEELPFKEGQIIKVFGDKDADGFYKGECNGKKGYIPCNMVSELEVENEEVEHQLLHHEFLTAKTSLEELEVFSTFPPTPHRLAIPPPKPRRLKKELNLQVCRTELNVARTMVAIFDYNPRESSPNVDVEAELTFNAGDIITIYGSMDDDGFYYGELNGHRGLVPSNFLEVSALTGKATNGILPQDVDSQGLHSERQRLRKKRRK